jgi:hypothetical protein
VLCRKAGVPATDVRGNITSHRARSTIASQLYNAKERMALFELQAWLLARTPPRLRRGPGLAARAVEGRGRRRTLDGVAEREGQDGPGLTVRGLALPQLLADLLDSGRWRHPGDDVLRAVVPWFEDPLVFLHSPGAMHRASWFLYEDGTADDPRGSALFHVVRGSVAGPSDLPWLDIEQAFDIAVNKRPGDDVSIALDYRTDPSDPRVVGSDAWTDQHQTGRFQYVWREVAPTFSAFAEALGLIPANGDTAGQIIKLGQDPSSDRTWRSGGMIDGGEK